MREPVTITVSGAAALSCAKTGDARLAPPNMQVNAVPAFRILIMRIFANPLANNYVRVFPLVWCQCWKFPFCQL